MDDCENRIQKYRGTLQKSQGVGILLWTVLKTATHVWETVANCTFQHISSLGAFGNTNFL